jgi:hypothetical protein
MVTPIVEDDDDDDDDDESHVPPLCCPCSAGQVGIKVSLLEASDKCVAQRRKVANCVAVTLILMKLMDGGFCC